MAETVGYKRVLLKLSGEILSGDKPFGVDSKTVGQLADEILAVHVEGVKLGIVVGGGNIFRGINSEERGIDRVSGDYMGMLATAINCLAMQDSLEKRDIPTRVMSAIDMRQVAEPYIRRRAERHLEKGRVLLFACGTGNPYFSTDTAASLRAMEIGAEILLKGTKVDGVYDRDPERSKDATMYQKMDFMTVLKNRLNVMDASAVSLCMDNELPMKVFNICKPGNLKKVISGENLGTLVDSVGE